MAILFVALLILILGMVGLQADVLGVGLSAGVSLFVYFFGVAALLVFVIIRLFLTLLLGPIRDALEPI